MGTMFQATFPAKTKQLWSGSYPGGTHLGTNDSYLEIYHHPSPASAWKWFIWEWGNKIISWGKSGFFPPQQKETVS